MLRPPPDARRPPRAVDTTAEERMKYIEKVLGDSAEEHAKLLAKHKKAFLRESAALEGMAGDHAAENTSCLTGHITGW